MSPVAIEVGGVPGQSLERPRAHRPLERHGGRVRASGRSEVSQAGQAWVSPIVQRVEESPRRAERVRWRTCSTSRRGHISKVRRGALCWRTTILPDGMQLAACKLIE